MDYPRTCTFTEVLTSEEIVETVRCVLEELINNVCGMLQTTESILPENDKIDPNSCMDVTATSSSEEGTRLNRVQRGIGIASFLQNLRTAGNLEHVGCTKRPKLEVTEDGVVPDKPKETTLNRKQRRALQFQQQQQEQQQKAVALSINEKEARSVQPPSIPTPPPEFKILKVDEASFQGYRASFGYGASNENNYVHAVSCSPCGSFAVSTSQDRLARCYDLRIEDKLELSSKNGLGDLIYDVQWRPTLEAEEAMFASTSRLHPIHMWRPNGERVATFRGIDNVDQVEAATSLGFVGADRLYGGFRGKLRYWDVERSGKHIGEYSTFSDNGGMRGRVMSLAAHPFQEGMFVAVGCSSLIGVYSERWKCAAWTFESPARAQTFAKYSSDGNYIYVSARKGNIFCFDVRTCSVVKTLRRTMQTDHRTRFDIDHERNYLYSGTSDGNVVAFDLSCPQPEIEPTVSIKIADTCVPAVSLCPKTRRLVACSGQRTFDGGFVDSDDEENNSCIGTGLPKNSVQLLSFQYIQ
ncbi:unnamed protein product [Caenorhabditis auriculariae]|uniref:WD repeat-containing protein 79 n=1 Tax=Caenorhabditis auriculariae TaxID=2777116 RepID=A0A8S1GMN5_9PELO|nr:unnamed protein product [Caenorhabditis auriculariae]